MGADFRLSTINLNLLVALDALLEKRSVTRAARSVGVSQPAMSRSLRNLRELFDDPILVRGKEGLIPTPRAARLKIPLSRTLDELGRVLADSAGFDPWTTKRVFRVAMPDYLMGLLGGALTQALVERAPNASVMLLPFDRVGYPKALEAGELDVAVHACLEPPAGLRSTPLVEDRFACAMRRDNPAAGGDLSLARYAGMPHVLIAISDDLSPGSVDVELREHGLERHVIARARSFLAAPMMLAKTDALLTAPQRLLELVAPTWGLEIRPAPLTMHGFCYAGVWHERFDADAGNVWLRDLLAEAAAEHPPQPGARDWLAAWGAADSDRRRRLVREAGTPVL